MTSSTIHSGAIWGLCVKQLDTSRSSDHNLVCYYVTRSKKKVKINQLTQLKKACVDMSRSNRI